MTTSRNARTDGDITRARILEAAGELFAAHGFADTQNKMIAAHAQVDMASINYHFGSRKGLYQAVLVTAHHHLLNSEELLALAEGHSSPEQKLQWLFKNAIASARHKDEWYIKVLSREIFAPSQHLQAVISGDIAPKLLAVRGIMSELTHLPVDHPAIDRCLLSVMAPCILMLASGSISAGPMNNVLATQEDELVEHMMTFAIAGLKGISQKETA